MDQQDDKEKKLQKEGRVTGPAFDFPISDSDFADIVDKRIEEIQKKRKELKLHERSEKMVKYWKGEQVDEAGLYPYQIPYKDNLVYRNEETRLAIMASKMPDVVAISADETSEKIEHARAIQKGLTIVLSDDKVRRLIKNVVRSHDLRLVGCIKVRYDKELEKVVYEQVHPSKVIFDMTATIPEDGYTSDNMEVIVEWIERPVARVIADFPDKKESILKSQGFIKGTAKQMNSKMRYQEIWFSFYGDDGKLYEGTGWKNGKTVYGKELNSYFDWEGYEKANPDKPKSTLYHNHFDRPRKPYLFVSYQNLGDGPIDDTTHIEQAIPLQNIVNKRGRQITEIADRTVPKLAALVDAITKEDLRRVTNDPDEHISIGGTVTDIRSAITSFQASGPSPVLFQDLLSNRTEIDALFSTQSTTRGATVPSESGISKQITREGDLGSHDDMSKVVVERLFYEMANWTVQLWKLFFEKEQMIKNSGKDGENIYVELKRDIIDDGLGINIMSNSVDKAQRRFDAQSSAARRQIDPLSYWEDLEAPNPKERTRRLIAFLSGDFKTYFDITDLANPEGKDNGKAEATVDIERLKQGDDFEPTLPTPMYLITMIDYTGSDDYKKQSDTVKNRFKDFIKKLKKLHEDTYLPPTDEQMAGGQPGQPGQPPQPGGQQVPPSPGQPLQGNPAVPSVTPVTGGGGIVPQQ